MHRSSYTLSAITLALSSALACASTHGREPPERVVTDASTSPAPAEMTCKDMGAFCGPTPDLPCPRAHVSLRADCPDLAPCCLPLPIPALGACWDDTDCFGALAPAEYPGSTAECERDAAMTHDPLVPGKCVCTENGTPLPDGRCGPILRDDDHLLCTTRQRFTGRTGTCDGDPCTVGSTCVQAIHETVFCFEPRTPSTLDGKPDPREYCGVVNCGDIRCEPPLRCVDAARGECVR